MCSCRWLMPERKVGMAALSQCEVQALSLKEVHEAEDELDDAADEAAELQAERLRESEQLERYGHLLLNPSVD